MEAFKTDILLNRTGDGFTLLQHAVTSRSVDFIEYVVDQLKQDLICYIIWE